MSHEQDVVAAIPVFNKATTLEPLIKQVLEREYAGVYLLDDASTDNSVEVARSFGSDIKVIEGKNNRGAAANRNRVINEVGSVILHYIDADMSLRDCETPKIIKGAHKGRLAGYIGGLVLEKDGMQNPFNFGPEFSLSNNVGLLLQLTSVAVLKKKGPEAAVKFRQFFSEQLKDWPDPGAEPLHREVFWAIEGNMTIKSDVLREVGGFDERLRFYESQDLSIRLEALGLPQYFDPDFATTHEIASQTSPKLVINVLKSNVRMFRKHGFINYITH